LGEEWAFFVECGMRNEEGEMFSVHHAMGVMPF
jgi:hypothetical protein